MRKPDDDLKIDIADLFGGELGPSDVLSEDTAENAAAAPAPTQAEKDHQLQEWRVERDRQLQEKSQEIERKIQEAAVQTPEPPASIPEIPEIPIVPVTEAPAPVPEITIPEIPEIPLAEAEVPLPTVDFNAPMAPPFMGPAPKAPSAPGTEPVPSTAEAPVAAAPEVPAPAAPDPEVLRKLQADHEFLMLYDEFRNIIAHELKDLVGDRKTKTMLGRTVELAREKFPEVFRNANWDSAGNLLEDGSMDGQRLIDNKNALDPGKADTVLDAALSVLLNLRLQAVEKGLGTGLKNKIRAHMIQWVHERTQKTAGEGKDISILQRLQSYVA